MSKMNIPADIRQYVSKKAIKKISLWLSLTLFIGLLIFLFGERCFHRLSREIKYTIYAVLLVCPLFIAKVYKLFDRSWCGKIVDIKAKYSTDSNRTFRPGRETLYLKETIYFYIETDNGRFIKKKAFENRANPNSMVQYYREGDRILHVGGTDYFQIINEDDDRVICVVCGTADLCEYEKCTYCDHTLKIGLED